MKLMELKTGTKLDLEVYNKQGELMKPALVSEFEWAEGKDTLYIAEPIHEGLIYPIHAGAIVNAYFILSSEDPLKVDLYKMRASVLERTAADNISLLKVKLAGDIEKVQRRQFFRIKCLLPVKYRYSEQPGNVSKAEDFKNALVKDISGGGLCIATEENVEINKTLELTLSLDNKNQMIFEGKVVRVSKEYRTQKYKYEIGISYAKISDKDREEIIRFIFSEQRKLRQKGLI